MRPQGIIKSSAVLAVLAALTLSGCTINVTQSPQTQTDTDGTSSETPATGTTNEALEQYADMERAELEANFDQFADVYSDMQVITKEPNTIIFSYTYLDPVDVQQTAANLDDMVQTLQDIANNDVFPAMEAAGVGSPKSIIYRYNDHDGTTFWEWEFLE